VPGRRAHAPLIATQPEPTKYDAGRWAAATLAVGLVGVVFVLAWLAIGRSGPSNPDNPLPWLESLSVIISYGVAGAVLLDRRPDLPFGWLLAGAAVLTVAQLTIMLPAYEAVSHGDDGVLVRWGLTASSFGFLPIAVQGLINVRFPSGRPATRRGAVLEVALVVGTALVLLGGFLGSTLPVNSGDPSITNPLTGGTAFGRAMGSLIVLAPVVVLLGLVAGLGVVIRFVRARGVERQQLKWRAVGVIAALALFPLAVTGHVGFLNALDSPLFVLTLAVPVLRYRLWSIDTILRRSVVYALITAVLGLGYVAVSVAAARVASDRVAAPVAAAVLVISFAPLRARVQRLVDRVFYGDRNDPYRMLRELSRRLNALPPGGVLSPLVEAVAISLRLPHVAIQNHDGLSLAGYGTPGSRQEHWPLTYEGRAEGVLVASPRRGEDGFDDHDRELLRDVASQLGVAVHAEGLTAELLRSRQRLVSAREEERRRLRRDLHDGLGPVLTAVGLNLDAVRARLVSDPPTAERHVTEAKEATAQALAELRRLVQGLRPPALDDLGLLGALHTQTDRLVAGSKLSLTIEADELPDLPAAVEVAVFRTVIEAVTNTVRHSNARQCSVRLTASGHEVELWVCDDGTPDGPWTPGVGLAAMRERADELGGSLRAGPDPAGGATVTARFPLPATLPEAGR
jgi:signal transduction histidine kinase